MITCQRHKSGTSAYLKILNRTKLVRKARQSNLLTAVTMPKDRCLHTLGVNSTAKQNKKRRCGSCKKIKSEPQFPSTRLVRRHVMSNLIRSHKDCQASQPAMLRDDL